MKREGNFGAINTLFRAGLNILEDECEFWMEEAESKPVHGEVDGSGSICGYSA